MREARQVNALAAPPRGRCRWLPYAATGEAGPAGCAGLLIALLAALGLAGPAHGAEQGRRYEGRAGAVVEKVIEAQGGRKSISRIRTLHARGTIRAIVFGDEGTYEFWYKRERKLRVETRYERRAEVRVLNGRRGFRGSSPGSLAPVEDHRYVAMVYQCKHIDLVWGLMEGRYDVTLEERRISGGREYEVLGLLDAEGPPMRVFVDTATYRIAGVTGYLTINGRQSDLASEFSEFRQVDGVLLPFSIVNYAGGRKIAENRIERYLVNEDMGDSLFEPR